MCLMQAIVLHNSNRFGFDDEEYVLPTNFIAYYYRKWWYSKPFHITKAMRKSLLALANSRNPRAFDAKLTAFACNKEYVSTGALLRSTPLILWSTPLDYPDEVHDAIKADAEFSHSNPLLHTINMLYGLAI